MSSRSSLARSRLAPVSCPSVSGVAFRKLARIMSTAQTSSRESRPSDKDRSKHREAAHAAMAGLKTIHRPHVRDVLARVSRSHSIGATERAPTARTHHRILPSPSSFSSSTDSTSSTYDRARRDAIVDFAVKHEEGFKPPPPVLHKPRSSPTGSSSSADSDRPLRLPSVKSPNRDSGILLPRRPPSAWISPLATPVTPRAKRIDVVTLSASFGDGVVGTTGLYNTGNSCYLNCVLQCLSATVPLARFLRGASPPLN